jgi:predicted secreted protein
MVRSIFALAAAVGLLASPAIAGNPQAANPAAAANESNPDQKICEKMTVTGSRLATRTVCATKREWDQRRLEERQLLDRSQLGACVETSVSAGHGQCHI